MDIDLLQPLASPAASSSTPSLPAQPAHLRGRRVSLDTQEPLPEEFIRQLSQPSQSLQDYQTASDFLLKKAQVNALNDLSSTQLTLLFHLFLKKKEALPAQLFQTLAQSILARGMGKVQSRGLTVFMRDYFRSCPEDKASLNLIATQIAALPPSRFADLSSDHLVLGLRTLTETNLPHKRLIKVFFQEVSTRAKRPEGLHDFSEINLSLLLSTAAKLNAQPSGLKEAISKEMIKREASQQLRNFTPLSLQNLLVGFAKQPPAETTPLERTCLDILTNEVVRRSGRGELCGTPPGTLALFAWALATLQHPRPDLLKAISLEFQKRITRGEETPLPALAQLLWSLATFEKEGVTFQRELYLLIAEKARHAKNFTEPDVAMLAWAYGVLQLPVLPLFDHLAIHLKREQLRTYKPLTLRNILWGMSASQCPSKALVHAVAEEVLRRASTLEGLAPFEAADLGILYRSFVLAYPAHPVLEALSKQVIVRAEGTGLGEFGLETIFQFLIPQITAKQADPAFKMDKSLFTCLCKEVSARCSTLTAHDLSESVRHFSLFADLSQTSTVGVNTLLEEILRRS